MAFIDVYRIYMNHHESTGYWSGKPPITKDTKATMSPDFGLLLCFCRVPHHFLQVLLLEVVQGALRTMAGGVTWLGIVWRASGSKLEDEAD